MDPIQFPARGLNPLEPAQSKWLGGVSGRSLAQPGMHMSVISDTGALPESLSGLLEPLLGAIFMLGDHF